MPFDLTFGQSIVILLRLTIPLLIFRRPLIGGLAAIAIDLLDVVIVELFGPGGMGSHYHLLDKYLDLYYLSFEAWVAWRWTEPRVRQVALTLFAYRVAGVLLFELTGTRWLLFVFPNLFENWFLFILIRNRYIPRLRLDSPARIGFWLLVLYIPKLGQEYLLHVTQAQPWNWIKRTLPGG